MLAGVIEMFVYLKVSLSFVLGNARHLAVAGGDLTQCQQRQSAGFAFYYQKRYESLQTQL